MNQQNQSKTNRSTSSNVDLRSDFRILKIPKCQNHRSTVVDGGINKLRSKSHVTDYRMNKENKQPLNMEAKKNLKKKIDIQKQKPHFKVGIPRHKFWSPTAKDTPISHFHGLDKGYKIRSSLPRRISQVRYKKLDNEKQPVACIEPVDSITANSTFELKKEEVVQELLEEINIIDESEKKIEIVEENKISDIDLVTVDDSEYQVEFIDVILIPAVIMILSIIIRFIIRINSLFYSWIF